MTTLPILRQFWYAIFAFALLLQACSPTYDWREVRGTAAPFLVLMPAKPVVESRSIDLDGLEVLMTMSVAEAGGVMFAVGTAETPDIAQAEAAIKAMKTALVNNVKGTVKSDRASASAQSAGGSTSKLSRIDIEIVGAPARPGGEARMMIARLVARDKWVYQAIVSGRENAVKPEAVETFFSSFKPG